jgi:hypothetical protein
MKLLESTGFNAALLAKIIIYDYNVLKNEGEEKRGKTASHVSGPWPSTVDEMSMA